MISIRRASSLAWMFAAFSPLARAQWLEPDCTTLLEVISPTVQDAFGWFVQPIGDVDGDGVPDLVTSAPLSGQGASAGGKVIALSGVDGSVIWSRVETLTSAILGYSLEVLDFDSDGVLDVLASAPFNGASGGHVYVFSGDDGATLHVFDSGVANENFGTALALKGDWDGDGVNDIAIGAAGHDHPTPSAGRVYVYSGATHLLLTEIAAPVVLAGDIEFGLCLAFLNDVSTPPDGRDELVVGHRGATFPSGRAIAFEFDGVASNVLYDVAVAMDYNIVGNRFGSGGDTDGDGAFDLLVGSNVSNLARLYSGRDGSVLHSFPVSGAAGTGGVGRIVHDLDADGCADVILGARGDDSGATDAGRASLHSGRTGVLLRTMSFTVPGRKIGWETRALPDHDGDGVIDFVLAGTGGGTSGQPPGSLVVVRGKPSISTYCTAKTTSGGCVPAIYVVGTPSASQASTCSIVTASLEPNRSALTFFSPTVSSATPFQGGWFCVGVPSVRLPVANSLGAASCSGLISYPLSALLHSSIGAMALDVGSYVYCQTWGRDPLVPSGTSLSDAVRFIVSP